MKTPKEYYHRSPDLKHTEDLRQLKSHLQERNYTIQELRSELKIKNLKEELANLENEEKLQDISAKDVEARNRLTSSLAEKDR